MQTVVEYFVEANVLSGDSKDKRRLAARIIVLNMQRHTRDFSHFPFIGSKNNANENMRSQ